MRFGRDFGQAIALFVGLVNQPDVATVINLLGFLKLDR